MSMLLSLPARISRARPSTNSIAWSPRQLCR
ncbi:hypothetical protein Ae406Ps2_6485c [Pseudonocardia sp. Ae406_Ps2]|nr:hypothetical protein Ae406Ps2_6485c [Pseudonocardia sp. Ae406_Ps2]